MIEIENVTKRFDGSPALLDVNASIKDNAVFGLIGTNGAGKSTLLRILSGILRPDGGTVKVDGLPVYDNIIAAENIFYISDDQYFFQNDTPLDLMRFYKGFYPDYNEQKFRDLMDFFELPMLRKARTFSKGMKKQLFVALGISSQCRYLLCDETFDGLDPVMREKVKGIFRADMAARGLTPVIASHSLRELDDICDQVGMLHKGGMIYSREEIDELILGEALAGSQENTASADASREAPEIHKVNLIFAKDQSWDILRDLNIVSSSRNGSIHTLMVKGDAGEILAKLAQLSPFFYEIVPPSLEDIFISRYAKTTGQEPQQTSPPDPLPPPCHSERSEES